MNLTETQDFDLDGPYRLFAWTILHKRVRSLRKRLQRLHQTGSAEAIHRTRVAARRLRTAMEIFSNVLPGRKLKAWNKPIRKLSQRLGAARDTDVQLELVTGLLAGPHSLRVQAGLERLELRWQQRRQKNTKSVTKAITRIESEGLLWQIQRLMKRKLFKAQSSFDARADQVVSIAPVAGELASAARDETPAPDPENANTLLEAQRNQQSALIAHHAAPALLVRLDLLLSYAPVVRQPEQIEQLHEMRIAAKHLRYALEMFAAMLGPEARQVAQAAKHLQDLLGEVHDADVWQQELPEFLVKETRRTIKHTGKDRSMGRITPGIEFLRRQRAEHRAQRYADFATFWDEKTEHGLWGELRSLLEAAAQSQPAEAELAGLQTSQDEK